jgi:hypothetical protein
MKLEHIEKLDSMIDNPSQHTTEEKVNIVVRVLRDIALQVRGHYNDIALLRGMIETIQRTLESLDDKLFGNKDNEGTIYTLKSQVDMMKKSFDNFTKVLWAVILAIVIDIVLRFFNII